VCILYLLCALISFHSGISAHLFFLCRTPILMKDSLVTNCLILFKRRLFCHDVGFFLAILLWWCNQVDYKSETNCLNFRFCRDCWCVFGAACFFAILMEYKRFNFKISQVLVKLIVWKIGSKCGVYSLDFDKIGSLSLPSAL